MNHDEQARFRAPAHHVKLWFALLIPPSMWMVGLTAKYMVVPFSCGSMNSWPTHALSTATLLITLAAGWLAWGLWQTSGAEWPDEHGTPVVRTRFMSMMALMSALIFGLAIVAQWISSAFLNPCMSI